MKALRRLTLAGLLLLLLPAAAPAADDAIERLEDFLTVSAFQGAFRVRLSGLLDLEDYQLQQPAPGLLYTNHEKLFNARLTLFLDGQLGSHVYLFVQARVDRGFDPGDRDAEVRLDEYALRYTPWEDGRLSVQVGKFATVTGNYVPRHLSWDNPFITAPLPYENLTGAWDSEAPANGGELLAWAHVPAGGVGALSNGKADKDRQLPVIWGPNYATGLSVAGRLGPLDYAAEVKNAALSSRPEYWDATAQGFDHPTFTGRVGFRPNEMWYLGFTASSGAYLAPEAAATLPQGRGLGDYREQLLAEDVRFEWHHFQLWAECFEARFQVPNVGDADTVAYYVEAKYKLAAQLFGALRWNQQLFGTVDDDGAPVQWGNNIWRIDASLGYRFTPHTQLKLQYSLQHEQNAPRDLSSLIAGQLTVRF